MNFSLLIALLMWLMQGVSNDGIESSKQDLVNGFCESRAVAEPPDYYTIDLVSTKRIAGSGQAVGKGEVTYLASPFGISLSANGSYKYRLEISVDRLRPSKKGNYVVWVTTPDVDQVQKIGVLPGNHKINGVVEWNKFLVVITLEPIDSTPTATWSGPIVLRGVSRSGLMHTMAGHGPFEDEPCALYGY